MPLGIDPAQILLHLFNVILLFGGLYFILYAPVKKFMKEREDQYAKREEETKEHLDTAKKTQTEYEERISHIEDEIAEKRQNAVRSLDNLKKEREKDARIEADKIIRQAQDAAKRERRKILMGVRDDIEDIISVATEKVALGEAQEENFDSFLDEVERSNVHANS